ncbi:ABC transporter permease [Endozoicomonas arenosclerae]|uniref:ABC transporter permease n=1 Tax=Endozoicomonas arenosclerae TaxID=1633495 RepID=UPI000785E690|nr:ABC transporter permease subunit [Endozoicomonas arenosclerae]
MVSRQAGKKALFLLMPFILVFFLFQVLPLIWVFVDSFKSNLGEEWGIGNYEYIFESRYFRQALFNSLKISLYSSIVGMLLALPCAWSLHRLSGRLKELTLTFANMIANFSGVPLAFAFVILLGANGCLIVLLDQLGIQLGFNLYSALGLILIYSYFQIPLAILLMLPAMEGLRDEWQEAACLLGAGKIRYWISIGLPVLMPGILGTFIILFANAMGTMATAFALTGGNYNLLTIRISNLISGDIFLDPWLASALSMVLVFILMLVTLANEWLIKPGRLRAKAK